MTTIAPDARASQPPLPQPAPAPAPGPTPGPDRGLLGRWRSRAPSVPTDPDATLLVQVLAARGLDACPAFLTPALTHLHDPSLMHDVDRAAERMLAALRAGEPIAIYGDYDVDGVSATAILYHTLRALRPDADVRTYVPHRLDEGYGLNADAITALAAAGARVIVSVDCGVTAVAPALTAKAAGVDLIITDHHNIPADASQLPEAFAVVHPRHPLGHYPFGDLCGAGVAYKLAWHLATMSCGTARVTEPLRRLLVELLALAALGVIADVVPLVGENRVIARFGLPRVATSPIEGLRALVAASGLDRVDAEDVGFKLGPRLNACGRMGHAAAAVELLTTASGQRAVEIARDLTRLNDARRRTETAIFDQACELAESRGMTGPDSRAIVLAQPGWHAGVVGIVCSRLVERYARPAILMDIADGIAHGSGRSIDAFNLHDALCTCADLMDRFGGHDMAAGLSLPAAHLDAFTQRFSAVAAQRLAPEDLVRTFDYDTPVALTDLTPRAVSELATLGPFGRANPGVRVRLDSIRLIGPPELFGVSAAHLALRVEAPGRERAMRLVGWKLARLAERIPPGALIDAIVAPKLSTWTGSPTVEPELIDLRLREHAAPSRPCH